MIIVFGFPVVLVIITGILWWKFRMPELIVASAGALLTLALTVYHVLTPLSFDMGDSEAWTPEAEEEFIVRRKVVVISSYGNWAAYGGLLVFALRVRREKVEE